MNLFGMAESLLGGSQQGGGNAALVTAVLSMINSRSGGLPGLIEAFEQHGLGGVVNSWVSEGPNQSVSPEQVQSVVGSSQVQDVASKLGVNSQEASHVIAQTLPNVISHLTPNGQVPQAGTDLIGMSERVLASFLNK